MPSNHAHIAYHVLMCIGTGGSPGLLWEVLDNMDENQDGYVDFEEMKRAIMEELHLVLDVGFLHSTSLQSTYSSQMRTSADCDMR